MQTKKHKGSWKVKGRNLRDDEVEDGFSYLGMSLRKILQQMKNEKWLLEGKERA